MDERENEIREIKENVTMEFEALWRVRAGYFGKQRKLRGTEERLRAWEEQIRNDEQQLFKTREKTKQELANLNEIVSSLTDMHERVEEKRKKQEICYLARQDEIAEAERKLEKRNLEMKDRESRFSMEEANWRNERSQEILAAKKKEADREREKLKQQRNKENERRRKEIGWMTFKRPSVLTSVR